MARKSKGADIDALLTPRKRANACKACGHKDVERLNEVLREWVRRRENGIPTLSLNGLRAMLREQFPPFKWSPNLVEGHVTNCLGLPFR